MNPGRLRHRVTFQILDTSEDTIDSDGSREERWLAAFPRAMPAEILPLSGRELIAADAVQTKVTARIRVRYHESYKARMRGVHRGTIYNIEAVVPDQQSGTHWLMLQCSTGVNNG